AGDEADGKHEAEADRSHLHPTPERAGPVLGEPGLEHRLQRLAVGAERLQVLLFDRAPDRLVQSGELGEERWRYLDAPPLLDPSAELQRCRRPAANPTGGELAPARGRLSHCVNPPV